MRDINQYADVYRESNFETYQVSYRRKAVVEQIVKYSSGKILEIGCGLEPLFQYVDGKEWVVVEPSEEFCKVAENKSRDLNNVRIFQGFFEEWVDALEKEKFDMVICSSLLHEIEKPECLLEDIYKVCTEETIVHINVPNAKSFHRILARNMGIINDEHEMSAKNIALQQNNVFDMEKLIEIVTKCQYGILDKGSYFIKPFTHTQMYKLMEHKIIDEKVLDGLYQMANELPSLGSEIFVNCRKSK